MKEIRGIRNNNPMNIRKGNSWKGERPVQQDADFEEFVSMEYGLRAGFKLMRNHITGFKGTRPKMNTIQKLIGVWAPRTENATDRYVRVVCQRTGYSPTQIIDPTNSGMMIAIAQAMVYVECGVEIKKEFYQSAWALL